MTTLYILQAILLIGIQGAHYCEDKSMKIYGTQSNTMGPRQSKAGACLAHE